MSEEKKFMQKLMESPLYENIEINQSDFDKLQIYFNNYNKNELSIDLYCPECKQISTFNATNEPQMSCNEPYSEARKFIDHYLTFGIIHYRCARNNQHYMCSQILFEQKKEIDNKKKEIKKNYIIKIGQYPSKADIEFPEFNRFSKILPPEKLSDLKRSAGLAAHGIGAGSFVYLRRVFEYLINEAYSIAVEDGAIDKETYEKARVNERIQLLKDYLPEIMVENHETYGILSKGVHELDEDTCKNAYPLLKDTIELILDEQLRKKEELEKKKKIRASIAKLGSDIKKA